MQRFFHGIAAGIAAIVVSSLMVCVMPGSGDRDACDKINNGYFRISFPQSGQSLKMGDLDSIQWSNRSLATDSTVSLYLYKDQQFIDTIKTHVGNRGNFSWTVPRVVAGDGYRIRIAEATDTSRFDMSCSFSIFSAYSGSFTFISPAAGAACTSGTSFTIKWQSTGKPGDSVSLRLCDDSIPLRTIIAKAGNGAFAWTVPAGLATKSSYRIKITSVFDLGISSLSAAFTIVGLGGDAYEPDNVPESASTIDSLGKPYYHSLTANDIDWIKFIADSAASYIIRISGAGGAAFYYGKDLTYMFELISDAASAGSSIPWTCTKSGVYYFKFTARKDSVENYSITIDEGSAPKSVVFLAPTASTVWNVGASSTIQWTPDTSLLGKSANIYLLKGSVQINSIAANAANSGSFVFTVDPQLASGSDYRIKIANAADTTKKGSSELFTIQGCAPDSFEPDNSRDKASKLLPNGKAQTHTLAISDTDWVAFPVDSGKTYRLLSSGSLTPTIRLFYGGEASPASDSNWSATGVNVISLKWRCPRKGAWYARITPGPAASGCGGYSFDIADIDSIVLVTISSPGQGANWAAGSTQQIKWTADTTILGKYAAIYLYKGQSQYLSIIGVTLNSGVYNWTIPNSIVTGSDYRIRIANYATTSQGGFSPAFTITGMTADTYEPDGKRDSASTLSPLGKSQSHTLTLNDTDWVKFTVDSGTTYTIQTLGNTSMGTFLFYGNDASYTTYFYTTSSGSLVTWKFSKSGVWYARIAAISTASGGTYLFNVTKLDSLTLVSFSSPTQGVAWSAGSTSTIQWTADSAILGTYVSLYLYKGSQQLSSISLGRSNTGSYSWYIPTIVATGSDYRIKIVNYNRSTLYGYSPVFTINGMAPDAYEPDGRRDSASTLSPLGKAQSHTLTMNDTDWVKFSADSGKNYALQGSGAATTRIYFYYGNEPGVNASFYGSSSPSSLTWACLRSGTWYARIVSDYSGSGGAYSFNITPFDSLPPVTFTNPTAASVWTAGSPAAIQWTPDSLILGDYVTLYLYKGGREVQYITGYTNTGDLSWTPPLGLATGADYQIVISNSKNEMFSGRSAAFSITGIAADSYEPDDTISKASAITTDGAVQNRTLPLGDMDWISFTAQKDSTYLMSARSEETTLGNFIAILYGSSIETYLAALSGTNPKIVWTCPQTGTYYFVLQSNGQDYGKYSVSIKNCSSGFAVDFTNPTALSIWSAGSAYSIQWTPDTALFGQYIQLQLTIDTTVVRLITSSARNSGTYSWTPPAGTTSGSKYSIRLSSVDYPQLFGASPAFAISGVNPDAFEPDDSAGISHTIATNDTFENHTLSLNDRDWFKFSGIANNLYVIKTTGATSSMSTQLTLYGTDARTSIATARSTTADSSATISMFCQTAGTYYLRVTSSTTGAYLAKVGAFDSTKYGLTLSAPIAGDTLAFGQVDTINWSSQVAMGGNVDIYLSNASGVVQTIAANATNTGARIWTVPSTVTAGSGYYIRIISRSNSHIYGSSGTFTIKGN